MATKSQPQIRVAIIGAGVSGLTSIKSCLEEGLDPVCYERRSKLGGLWNYSDEVNLDEGAAITRSTVLNSCKEMGTFSDFPFPKESTPFVTHRKALQHLVDYARHFDLEKYIKFKTHVTEIKKNENDGKFWKVSIQNADSSVEEEYFDYVMVCTGVFGNKHMPQYPGLDTFEGIKIHANEYRDALPYRGKKVLVVGGSHTAGEIACEIARNDAEVYISIHNGTLCFPRSGKDGLPTVMTLFTRANCRSLSKLKSLIRLACQVRIPDYNLMGLQSENPTSLMINDEIQDRIIQGQLTPVVGIEEFDKNSVKIKDGTVLEDIDAVIFATGYELSIPIIKQSWIYNESDYVQTYKYIFPLGLDHPERLAFIGIVSIVGPSWPVYEMQARWATRVFTKNIKLPNRTTMLQDIQSKPIFTGNKYKYVLFVQIMDELAEEMGVKPSFWRLALSNPKLAYFYEYGPVVPYWYRLQGPGAWSGARDAILNVWENTIYSTKRFGLGKTN
ncbi:dimethylaniline monooxygenase [N-oxide-forming] 2-like [Glandiceps talaboti]